MSTPVKPRRPYVSTRRTETARATRAAIVAAATERFAEVGYAATTIEAVADRAGVSPKTVYAIYASKRGLLAAVLDQAIAGDDAPVPILEREWVTRMRSTRGRTKRLEILATEGAAILGRRAAVDALMTRAADADPEVAELLAAARAQRRAGQAALLAIALAPDPVDEEQIDALFAIGSPEIRRLLVDDRGWSDERFAAWYVATVRRLFGSRG